MTELAPGATHLPHYLSLEEQILIAGRCLELGAAAAGFCTPIVRSSAAESR